MRSGLASTWHTGVWIAFSHCSEAFIAGRTVARFKLSFRYFPAMCSSTFREANAFEY